MGSDSNKEDVQLARIQQSITNRKSKRSDPQKMGQVVNRLMARRGYARVQANRRMLELWSAVVGDRLSSLSRPGNVRRSVLEVVVSNSSATQELLFDKKRILEKLNEQLVDQPLKDMRFRAGAID